MTHEQRIASIHAELQTQLDQMSGLLMKMESGDRLSRDESTDVKEGYTRVYNLLTGVFPIIKSIRREVFALQPGDVPPQ